MCQPADLVLAQFIFLGYRAMGVYEMLKFHAPPILILLHLHLVNNVNLRSDEASASAFLVCFFPEHVIFGWVYCRCRSMTGWNFSVAKAKSVLR